MNRDAIIVVNTEGLISSWNQDAEELFGYSVNDVMGKSLDFLVPKQYRGAHWIGFHKAMSDPHLKDLACDIPVLCSDGKVRYFAGRLLVLIDALGNAVGAVATLTNAGEVGFRPFDKKMTNNPITKLQNIPPILASKLS